MLLAIATLGACSQSDSKPGPAKESDIRLYRTIGSSYVCNARTAKIDFDKALGVSAATYAQLLRERHGGFVVSAGKQKLTDKRLFTGAADQILAGALLFCPKLVPEDVKARVNELLKEKNSGSKD